MQFCVVIQICLGQNGPYKDLSWSSDGLMFATAVTIGLVGDSFTEKVDSIRPEEIAILNRNDVNWFDRSATYNGSENAAKISDYVALLCVIGPIELLFHERISSDWGKVTSMYAQTLLLATLVPSISKGAIERTRPIIYTTRM